MDALEERARQAFVNSRKLGAVSPTAAQVGNVLFRLRQLFSDADLTLMDDRLFLRQVERVWPVAQYVDRDS